MELSVPHLFCNACKSTDGNIKPLVQVQRAWIRQQEFFIFLTLFRRLRDENVKIRMISDNAALFLSGGALYQAITPQIFSSYHMRGKSGGTALHTSQYL